MLPVSKDTLRRVVRRRTRPVSSRRRKPSLQQLLQFFPRRKGRDPGLCALDVYYR
jgi:hypothetical protein